MNRRVLTFLGLVLCLLLGASCRSNRTWPDAEVEASPHSSAFQIHEAPSHEAADLMDFLVSLVE